MLVLQDRAAWWRETVRMEGPFQGNASEASSIPKAPTQNLNGGAFCAHLCLPSLVTDDSSRLRALTIGPAAPPGCLSQRKESWALAQ